MQNYKELRLWQESHALTKHLYSVTKSYPAKEKFGIVSQIRRAAVSVPSNSAEGCGRRTQKNFGHFLQMALGSINELDYLCFLSSDLFYLTTDDYKVIYESLEKIRAMTINLINRVNL